MSDFRIAELVRRVSPTELLQDLIDEAKAGTWTHRREHALVVLENGEHVLVRGGADGIEFELTSGGKVVIAIEGVLTQVVKLAWHTHPEPTGPSDHDRRFLLLIGQGDSLIFEIRGAPDGTRFTADERRDGST